jgi:hypothetical protein
VIVRIEHQQLNIAIESVVILGTTHKYSRRIKSLLLSLRRVLSIYFRIVLVVIIRIPLLELIMLRNY